MPLTQDLGRFAAGLTFEALPAVAVEIARTGIIYTVATMLAGAHDAAPQLLRRGLDPPPGPATLYSSGETATAPEAAWINGTAGHALDYDDVAAAGMSRQCWCRPSSPRPRRSGWAGARSSPPMSPGMKPGPSWRAATPGTITRRAGTRPGSSGRSAPAQPAPRCAGSTRRKRPRRSRWQPR